MLRFKDLNDVFQHKLGFIYYEIFLNTKKVIVIVTFSFHDFLLI